MNAVDLNEMIAELLRGHGLSVSQYKEWLVANGGLPGISANIAREFEYEDSHSVQLDVRVAVDSETVIVESFGGFGDNRDAAIRAAFGNFILNSLHPLLAAFYLESDDQVTIERWEFSDAIWKVIIGNYGLRCPEGVTPSIPEQLFATIERLIKGLSLSKPIHWVRLYYGHVNTQNITIEVLLDNEEWVAAQEMLASLEWPSIDGFYSIRLFLILQREDR